MYESMRRNWRFVSVLGQVTADDPACPLEVLIQRALRRLTGDEPQAVKSPGSEVEDLDYD